MLTSVDNKKKYSKHIKKNKMKKSKRLQYIKKGGGINKYQKIIDTSETITNMISDLKNEQEFTDTDLIELIQKYFLPDSDEENIKKYLHIINNFLHKKRDPLTIELKSKYRPFDTVFLKNGNELILAFDGKFKIQ